MHVLLFLITGLNTSLGRVVVVVDVVVVDVVVVVVVVVDVVVVDVVVVDVVVVDVVVVVVPQPDTSELAGSVSTLIFV